ncbi:TBC1 domain family member 2A [Hypsibius exemplaris]|uniref:TBC1 domain family member 2A n=1 Tax=Hypsibius exemplaris TaxID=2072580 RepID=A0A1W0X6T0_HYPEX|nr:TBC1 domain family member 2A [Hypsibius exemplaris]
MQSSETSTGAPSRPVAVPTSLKIPDVIKITDSDAADDFVLPVATIRPETSTERLIPDAGAAVPLQFTAEKLSGWLTRHKKTLGMKTSDRKWYEFVDDRCKLFVFQGPDEPVPQESIDIGRAAIVVDPEFSEKPGVFALSIDNQTIVLEAFSSDEMRRWIQELQKRRELFLKIRSVDTLTRGHTYSRVNSSNASSSPAAVEENRSTSAEYDFCAQPDEPTGLGSGDTSASGVLVSFDDILYRTTKAPLYRPDQDGENSAGLDIPSQHHGRNQPSPTAKRSENKPMQAFRQMFGPNKVEKVDVKHEKALEDRLIVLQDELLLARDELTAQKEIVTVLRRQLDFTTKEKEALRTLVGSTDKEAAQMQILRDRCRLILELEEALQNSRSEKDTLVQRSEILKNELLEMARQSAKLRENLRNKENAIVLLTEQVTKQELSGPRPVRNGSQRSLPDTEDQVQKMRDILEAYKEKLAFLNEEIVSQNNLRTEMAGREEVLLGMITDWEAKHARLESRLLYSLKDMASGKVKSILGSPEDEVSRIRQRILDEALGGSEADAHVKAVTECDRYGFFVSRLHYTNEEYLERKALEAERRQRLVNLRKDPSSADLSAKWDSFLTKQTRLLQKSEELKNLMRIGCPDGHRGRVWKSCVEWRVSAIKTVKGVGYYQSLVKDTAKPLASSAAKQIKIDLCRTLPNNVHFMNMESDMIPRLEEVLLAFSRHNPAVAYCQGMNRLVAVALLFLNEEDAFWCLVAIVEYLLPGYFTINMIEAQTDQRIFRDLFATKLPELFSHLSQQLDPTLYSFNWFLTVFVDNMHPDIFLPIWDAFLVEGKKVLFRFSLAMFKYFEDVLMEITDQNLANKLLRNLGDRVTDLRKLQAIAFETLNPFPMKLVKARRAVHLPEIMAEMQQLEKLRASVSQSHSNSNNQEEDDL